MSSINSPCDTINFEAASNYCEEISHFIKSDGGELKKPIIIIWNTSSIIQIEGKVDVLAKGGNHW